MSTYKYIDRICCAVFALVIMLTGVLIHIGNTVVPVYNTLMGYEAKLFDATIVHTIDIQMDDWDSFLETCENEEYVTCAVVIDNETYKNVGIRAKGNTSLSSVAQYGNDRYSFKIEFDHYDDSISYYGLDKLSLNNIIQDNTYMKDFLTYQMMGYFGVASPLCSYAYITVNGEDWGLYLAIEGVEESFLERNYGTDYGNLYKPDSMDMGGGRGNGKGFEMELPEDGEIEGFTEDGSMPGNMEPPPQEAKEEQAESPEGRGAPEDMENPEQQGERQKNPEQQDDRQKNMDERPQDGEMSGDMAGNGDVSLVYSDDSYDSYSNIFENAKTDISDADKDRLIDSLERLNEQENIEETVDVDAVIRYFVVHNFVCNFDSYTGSMIHNYYLYEDDGILSMIPWDYNLAFGGFQAASDATELVNYPIDSPVSGGTIESRPMLSWIFSDESYLEQYHQYFAEFITSYFDSGYFEALIESTVQMIAPYVEKDPTKFCTYEEFEKGVETLKDFCLLRAESVKGQLDGSIPATSEMQEQDSSVLINASSLSISAMGSMENGKMGIDNQKNKF